MTDDSEEHPIDKSLNLAPSSTFSDTISTIVANARNDSAKEDFTYARSNIREVISNAADAVVKLAQIADQSQSARDFEVLARLMDTVTNASEKLLRLQKSIRELDKVDEPSDPEVKQLVTNNLFVGSTAELSKIINDLKT